MSFNLIIAGILLLLSHNIGGLPPLDSRENKEIVGQATNIITAKLLKGNVENQKNSIFSPIGYASILAILGEGAHEETNNDINTVLKHPNDRASVRGAYRSVLSHLQGMDPQAAPQFRSWFYIYKNNTIDDSYREILVNDFYVTVRNVEPYEQQSMDATTYSIVRPTEEMQSSTKAPDDKAKNEDKPTNSKDIVEFDSFKMEGGPVDETRIDTQNDPSKFDEVIEDQQYVEVPLIKDEMAKHKVETVNNEEAVGVGSGANDAKKVLLPLKQYEEMEIMQAAETRLGKVFGGKSGEGASIVSGGSIVGEKENLTETDTNRFEPKMLLFNGLYYHGNWATPFQHLRDENVENIFNTMNGQRIPIKMMKAQGYFKTANITKYKSEAVEFPYENIRYSMLVVIPEGSDGLKYLINEFNANTLNEISNELADEFITVNLPRFEVQTTSGAEKVLAKEGLASLFTSKADFSGISKSLKLRLDELQQHVNLRVDETSSAENFLTASIALRSNGPLNDRTIVINRPFLFFVRDRIDDVTIVAGKITSLESFAMDEPEISQ
ncbi:alpha-1-antiproteinase S-like [Contarinia nasturtii]|uniref:alpha-1-antiproteinase S-like n=1 Tax=Contarinia nasturtii TaxID=265458 RepID=UPI0012D3B9B0|nr:alpha-1-antiproteinase S-like [Contarinia nasturtii]